MTFDFLSFRFVFSALETVAFPAGQPGNILRGAFGLAFRAAACTAECPGVGCAHAPSCKYARVFEPASVRPGPSGLKNWPRPFVFRAAYLDGRTIEGGERFWFDFNLFDTEDPPLNEFAQAFAEMGKSGLGPSRARVELVSVEQRSVSVSLAAHSTPTRKLAVDFVTPTELKSGEELAARPDFGVLFARARDRVNTLRTLYGPGSLDIDFRGMGQRAQSVRMTRCDLRDVKAARRSSRTGQIHSIGGFVGTAEYEGELTEFVPYLEAAQWTGVGRQCGWGKGELRLVARP